MRVFKIFCGNKTLRSHMGILSHVSQLTVKHTYLLSLVIQSNILDLVPQISVVLHTTE